MKITIYTINDCKFSQAEKEYLKNNNIPFEEKNLETNRDYLTEMLKVSDHFAGTPVTKVEKDGGEIMILKGFTQDEFAKALNLSPSAVVVPNAETDASQTASTPTPPLPQASSSTPPITSMSTPTDKPADDASANKPDMTIESLSEPAVSTQSTTDANPPEPIMPPIPPAPAVPMSIPAPADTNPSLTPNEEPVNPLENQEVGPISLDTSSSVPAPMQEPIAPPTIGASSPQSAPMEVQPATEEKPKNSEGLDSVLQNLQSQVQAGVPPTDTTPKS